MTPQDVKRKLTAILSADVKGYSRLMGKDEAGTIQTLTTYKEAMTALIEQYHGRVVDAPGDNVLAEFPSVVAALQCAVEIQKELKERNRKLPLHRQMEFRIGINLGDVVEEENKIFGDGVNIAARLENLSEPGGICISGTVYEQVKDKLSLNYVYLGKQTVKNIADPLRVYRVLTEPASRINAWKLQGLSYWKRVHPTYKIIIALVAAANAAWPAYTYITSRSTEVASQSTPELASKEKKALPLPETPSIAVLPFVNMSGDKQQDYFADGLTEEIINAVAKLRNVLVVARNSTFTYKGKDVNVQQVARDMGVRYVLEGSVRKTGDKVRITAQLIDGLTGNHIFSERYERPLKDIFALQDEITMKVLTSMRVELSEGETARVTAKGTKNLEAYLKVMQASQVRVTMNKQAFALSQKLAEEAIALDPNYALAYSIVAIVLANGVMIGQYEDPKEILERAQAMGEKAVKLDDSLAYAHSVLSQVLTVRREYDRSIAEAERAVDLEPGSAFSYFQVGASLNFSGQYEKAIPQLKNSMRLSPIPIPSSMMHLGIAYLMLGRYEESIAVLKQLIHREPNMPGAHGALAAAYIMAGKEPEARAEAAELLRINPDFSLQKFEKGFPLKSGDDLRNRLIEPQRKAGLK